MRIGFNNLFSTEVFNKSIKSGNIDLDLNIDLVESEFKDRSDASLDGFVHPLHLLADQSLDDLSVAALLPIGKRTYSLIMHKSTVNPEHRLGFLNSMMVAVPSHFVSKGLAELSSEISFSTSSSLEILTSARNNEVGNFILESCFVNEQIEKDYKVIELNEREFGHAPGQGLMAFLVKKESRFLKLIKQLNRKEVIAISNVERKTAKLAKQLINIHCENDQAENYLLWVFTENGNAQVAQSTRNMIEERIIDKLLNA